MTELIESISALIALATAGILLAMSPEDRASGTALFALLLLSAAIMILAHAAEVTITKGA